MDSFPVESMTNDAGPLGPASYLLGVTFVATPALVGWCTSSADRSTASVGSSISFQISTSKSRRTFFHQ